VLGDEPADVLYKVDCPYERSTEGGILWCDPALGISWPCANPLLSSKDRQLPGFDAYRRNPVHWQP
jgi:dTDP-4-dehydrorhamnose 3,5-epimerase